MPAVSLVATLVATVLGFVLGALWYGPLFGKRWMAAVGMTAEEIRQRSQKVWDSFYSLALVWKRSRICPTVRSRLAFLFCSKLYRQMYANTGIATDSARVTRSTQWARLLAKPCRRLFQSSPMPDLQVPERPDLPVPELPLPVLEKRLDWN